MLHKKKIQRTFSVVHACFDFLVSPLGLAVFFPQIQWVLSSNRDTTRPPPSVIKDSSSSAGGSNFPVKKNAHLSNNLILSFSPLPLNRLTPNNPTVQHPRLVSSQKWFFGFILFFTQYRSFLHRVQHPFLGNNPLPSKNSL